MKRTWMKTLVIVLSAVFIAGFVLSLTGGIPEEPLGEKEGIAYDPDLILYSRGWTVSSGDASYSPAGLPFRVPGSGYAGVTMTNVLPAHVTGGSFLAFRVSSCFVDVYIGEELIYSAPVTENMGKKTPVPGWICVPLLEGYSGRTIKISARDPYLFHSVTVPEIIMGSHAEVLLYASGTGYTDYYISVAVMILGLLVIFFAFMRSGISAETLRNTYFGAFITVAGVYLLCRAGMTRMDAYQSYVEYMASGAALRLCPVIYAAYMSRRAPKKKLPSAFIIASLAFLAGSTALHFAGILDYTSTEGVALLLIIAELVFSLVRERESSEGASRFRELPLAGLLFAIGSFALSAVPSLGVYPAAAHARYILLFAFALTAAADLALSVSSQAERSALLAKELSESRMKIMMSQMQPHFIYNTLSTIRAMIQKSPEEARELLFEFTRYLRFNLNALGNVPIIPIEEELEHAKVYTDIEQARFGDALKVTYDIGEDSFSVPPLTVQPFVENAVKHGIRKDTEGGSILVRTYAGENEYIVEIEDDGTGFDTAVLDDPSRRGVGIMNAVTRLKAQTGADVDIQSEKGKGTRVRISIPKDWEDSDENYTRG